jgi:hypothetical protein
VEAGSARQHDVQHGQVEALVAQEGQRLVAIEGELHLETLLLKVEAHEVGDVCIVVGDKDANGRLRQRRRHHRGPGPKGAFWPACPGPTITSPADGEPSTSLSTLLVNCRSSWSAAALVKEPDCTAWSSC